ncbi:MAG TPA: SHOCT domain-containing protein [Acidimicrobiales bacterium]
MPGLLRGVARTAVVAGTATAVSGRVSRRQAEKYSSRDAQIYADRDAAYQQQTAAAQPAPAAPPPPPEAPAESNMIEQLKQLAELHTQGILTDDEFAAQKAKLLG